MTANPPAAQAESPPPSVDGIEVYIDGTGAETIVMLHGWPDSYRLWDSTVEGLQQDYRCVRFTLPGFDTARPARAMSLAATTALIRRIIDTVSPDRPVTLLLHDWGCIYGFEYAARQPDRVARIVAVDIGDHNSDAYLRALSTQAKLSIVAYQLWLAAAWYIKGPLGNAMTRKMIRALRCPSKPATPGWQQNYPYAMQWFGLLGGFKQAARVDPHCPTLYLYGQRKPFMFHSPAWLEKLAARADCAAQGFDTGHWVMVQQPAAFNAAILSWLVNTPAPDNLLLRNVPSDSPPAILRE
ncbi:MAG: alpha/beta hydrolase [Burkholderiales bacterium]|nr:alpha/beta hydrolase [Burkholderiales bacterium]